MSKLQGCVAFTGAGDAMADRLRVGLGLAGPGLRTAGIWRDGRAALALAQRVVTVEDRRERQPTRDAAGRVLVFDGCLFAPRELAHAEGFDPDLPDSALAAAWLDRHGPDALVRLRGDYAFARWDPAAQALVLAVAPMAGRALYWYAAGGGLWFAGSLADLFRLAGVPREPSPLQLAAEVSALVLDPADSLFRGVRLVAPGTLLTARAAGVCESVFWRPDPSRRLRLRSDEDYVEAARELLDRAVQVRLRAAAAPATMLTGGLDSAAIAATAARQLHPEALAAYTSVPPPGQAVEPQPGLYADERDPVAAIAAMHGNLQTRFCHSDGPSAFERDPVPLFVASGRSTILANHLGWFDPLYRAVRDEGHVVLLHGMAGNFTLSYSGAHAFADLLRAGRPDLVLRLFPKVMRFRRVARRWAIPRLLAAPLMSEAWRRRALRWAGRQPAWRRDSPLRPDFITAVGLEDRMDAAGVGGLLPHDWSSRSIQAHFLYERQIGYTETLSALGNWYGLELRDPLADPDLVEFCLAVPRQQFMLDGRDRSLARRALADRLPSQVTGQHRRGQQNPEWFQRLTPQRAEFAAELAALEQVPLAAEMLDLKRLKALLDDWPSDAVAAQSRRFAYESMLPRAIQMGRFLRWLDGGNR